MSQLFVTKEFRWEMGHALWNYDGLCKYIHGHSYILMVTVTGEVIHDKTSVKDGMLIDFGDLSRIVNGAIVHPFDHALVLNKQSIANYDLSNQMFGRTIIVDFQPTCENMIHYFADLIKDKFPENVKLHSLKLYETAKSFAELVL